mmetsp:Transcript_109787/g.310618  ORF Transcript_109787/g.310618 Transcript_109787/m.310618 type:complete len:162 (+) Transcript_109787:108-593(+)|eukprot:CAMPEP_0179260636 /NCGR_PEP_ID=MMETSP0797-20121207/26443_1 /TAXON_ID=47934 /ORGANISM="Dinophysis acuminata, Strain DAEP01" /LENGTH=161 /DNA_ID=CAMNT_0020968725 /DNA_START=107 /DNA_END=592 /DNA_ORIENTATION=-
MSSAHAHFRDIVTVLLLFALSISPAFGAFMLRGSDVNDDQDKSADAEPTAWPRENVRCPGGCSEATKIWEPPREATAVQESCTCTARGDDCTCVGDCTKETHINVCTELLGPCVCSHFEEAICECRGYCHSKADREDACYNEVGCDWTGYWCEAQVGLLWE